MPSATLKVAATGIGSLMPARKDDSQGITDTLFNPNKAPHTKLLDYYNFAPFREQILLHSILLHPLHLYVHAAALLPTLLPYMRDITTRSGVQDLLVDKWHATS
jgi:hypothetical protein